MAVVSLSGNFFRTISDDKYYYTVGLSGLAIIARDTLEVINECYTSLSGHRFTDIWTDQNHNLLYIGSSGNGVLSISKENILASSLETKLGTRYSYPEITSNIVTSIDGNGNGLLVGTNSGVTYIDTIEDRSYSSYSLLPVSGVSLSPSGSIFYYGGFGLAGLTTTVTDNWTMGDLTFVITTSGLPTIIKLPIYDVDSVDHGEYVTLGIATASGTQIMRYHKGRMARTSSMVRLFKEDM